MPVQLLLLLIQLHNQLRQLWCLRFGYYIWWWRDCQWWRDYRREPKRQLRWCWHWYYYDCQRVIVTWRDMYQVGLSPLGTFCLVVESDDSVLQ